jgi:hypothetical protein
VSGIISKSNVNLFIFDDLVEQLIRVKIPKKKNEHVSPDNQNDKYLHFIIQEAKNETAFKLTFFFLSSIFVVTMCNK